MSSSSASPSKASGSGTSARMLREGDEVQHLQVQSRHEVVSFSTEVRVPDLTPSTAWHLVGSNLNQVLWTLWKLPLKPSATQRRHKEVDVDQVGPPTKVSLQ